MSRLLLVLVLAAGLLTWQAPQASADFCAETSRGNCTYIVITGDPPGQPCVNEDREPVFCTRGFPPGIGYWSNLRHMYIVLSPTAWIWAGDEATGNVTFFLDPETIGGRNLAFSEGTLPIRPAGPSAEELATTLINSLPLAPIAIGIVPEPYPDRVGLIGMPQWMWVANPGETTTGPLTRSLTQAGVTVTATAQVTRIVWDMGDGNQVTCANLGTPYEDRYGKSDSPSCGYHYTRQGEFTVTATTHWAIAWTGAGQRGTVARELSTSVRITMGELQVLNTSPRR